ncbi:uncharacterized protein LOC142333640 isoform X2 [Lycorma delicatula]
MWYDNIIEGIVDDDVNKVVEILECNTNEIKRVMTNFKLYYLFYKTKSKEMVIALLDYFDVKNVFDITLLLTSIINVAIMHCMGIETIQQLIDRGGIINDTDVRHVSPLLQSIKSKRNLNFVKKILEMGADVNEICDDENNTILHIAVSNCCSGDDIEIIKLLVDSGANINAENCYWEKPLMKLPLNSDEDLWLELMKRKLYIYEGKANYSLQDNFLTTVVAKTSRIKQFLGVLIFIGFMPHTLNKVCNRLLYLALKNNCSVDCIIEIIDNGANVNEMKYLNDGENDYTAVPLFMALQLHRGEDIISVLINNGADVNAIDEHGVTPLICAINNNYEVEIINKLINFGADVNKCDLDRVTPLMFAIKNNDNKVTALLINAEADVNAVDMFGRTILRYAVIYINDEDIINVLIKKGADFSKINDCHDGFWFNIKVAKKCDNKFFAEFIPNRKNVNIKDEFSQTVLMNAIELNMNENIIFNIIRNGANINATDNKGFTPLIYAIKYECNVSIVIKLIQHGANVNVIDNNGLTPLKHAVHSSMFKEVIKILIDNGVNINTHDENSSTVLLYILKHVKNNKEHVNFVIQKGADVNVCDNKGLTPLMYSIIYDAESNEVENATALMENGASIDATDVEGHTALYYAFSLKYYVDKYVCLLLEYGASVHKFGANLDEDKTLLSYALNDRRDIQIVIELLHCKEDISEVNEFRSTFLYHLFINHAELALLFISDRNELLKNDSELIENIFTNAPDVYIKRLLFFCGLDINFFDEYLQTPLIFALIGNRNVKLIKAILENGGNAKLADFFSCTPLHYTSSPEIINLLIVYGNVHIKNDYECLPTISVLRNCDSCDRMYVEPFIKHFLLVNNREELETYSAITDNIEYCDFINECEIELTKMQSTNIVDKLSFFKFCCKLSKFEMNLISESDNFFYYNDEQIRQLFPIYNDIILMKIKKCKIDLSKKQLTHSLDRIILTNKIIKSYDPKKYEAGLNNCCSIEHSDQFCECAFLNYDILYCISKYLFDRHIVNLLLASL